MSDIYVAILAGILLALTLILIYEITFGDLRINLKDLLTEYLKYDESNVGDKYYNLDIQQHENFSSIDITKLSDPLKLGILGKNEIDFPTYSVLSSLGLIEEINGLGYKVIVNDEIMYRLRNFFMLIRRIKSVTQLENYVPIDPKVLLVNGVRNVILFSLKDMNIIFFSTPTSFLLRLLRNKKFMQKMLIISETHKFAMLKDGTKLCISRVKRADGDEYLILVEAIDERLAMYFTDKLTGAILKVDSINSETLANIIHKL